MIVHPRTAIREYACNALKDATDVGQRVFLNRPNAILLQELPAIVIYFNSETAEVTEGDDYVPSRYDRTVNISVDVIAEQSVDPSHEIKVEAKLDRIARQVERKFFNDRFFNQMLDDYEDHTSPGLLAGMRLVSTIPDTIDTSGGTTLACQNLIFSLVYVDEPFTEEKSSIFETYLMQINRVGWDETTVDPTLIEASGTIED